MIHQINAKTMTTINEKMTICSIVEAIERGYLPANTTVENKSMLFVFYKPFKSAKNSIWTPIIEASTIKNENSTHSFEGFFFNFPKGQIEDQKFAFLNYCEKIADKSFEAI